MSFTTAKKDLVGIWRWLYVIDTETEEKIGIKELSMGMTSKVRLEFKEDNTTLEQKTTTGTNKVSTTLGEWRLEKEGSVLEMRIDEKWTPSRIISISGDSLVLEMSRTMHLVMLKEK